MTAPVVVAAVPRLDSRVAALDGIRGVAIVLVLAGHVIQNHPGLPANTRLWLAAFANSSAGVRLFFVLSGYLITTLLAQEWERCGTVSISRFYWRRAVRIFPAFYAFLIIVGLLIALHLCAGSIPALASAATFTWNYAFLWLHLTPAQQWTFGHLWTLALEQQFYVFWPILLRFAGLKRGLYWAIGLAVWCPVARVATYYLVPSWRGYVGIMLHTAIDSIIIGCAIALLTREYVTRQTIKRHAVELGSIALVWLFLASPILSVLIRGLPIVAGFTADALAAALLIASVHLADDCGIARFFRGRALAAIGVISYSWYLWQQLFLAPTRIHSFADGAIGIILSGLIAGASYVLIERPVLKWGRRFMPGRHGETASYAGNR